MRNPTPLEEKIAQALHECEWHQRGIDRPVPSWEAYPEAYRELWRRQARCVITALNLSWVGTFTGRTPDAVSFEVEGAWTE